MEKRLTALEYSALNLVIDAQYNHLSEPVSELLGEHGTQMPCVERVYLDGRDWVFVRGSIENGEIIISSKIMTAQDRKDWKSSEAKLKAVRTSSTKIPVKKRAKFYDARPTAGE